MRILEIWSFLSINPSFLMKTFTIEHLSQESFNSWIYEDFRNAQFLLLYCGFTSIFSIDFKVLSFVGFSFQLRGFRCHLPEIFFLHGGVVSSLENLVPRAIGKKMRWGRSCSLQNLSSLLVMSIEDTLKRVLNSFMAEDPIIQKPVHWFAL